MRVKENPCFLKKRMASLSAQVRATLNPSVASLSLKRYYFRSVPLPLIGRVDSKKYELTHFALPKTTEHTASNYPVVLEQHSTLVFWVEDKLGDVFRPHLAQLGGNHTLKPHQSQHVLSVVWVSRSLQSYLLERVLDRY